MTIFEKALQLALEAMQKEVELATAIIKKVDVKNIGADNADRKIPNLIENEI
jgi:hypothetical protein